MTTACFARGQQSKNNLSCIIHQAMIRYTVPAASLAIINHNQITLVRVYKNPNYPKLRVTTNTMFQAASMSKSVVAFAALRLIQQKKLTLDGNVNNVLKTWKIPKNKFTRKNSVTVRNIVSMTSGLSVHGFAGYSVGAKLPSLVQILNGQSPANSKPIRVIFVPGTKYLYSGGGLLVLQQLMTDVTNKSFPLEMKHLVLRPLGMKNSLFARSLDKKLSLQVIPGFYSMAADNRGGMVEGGWHNYPELGAGGLWTTPKDLAKFVINITKSYQGKKEGLLKQSIAKKMLTRQKNSVFGLGVCINGKGRNLIFSKGGRNLGYTSLMIGFPNTGQGAILMINCNDNLPFIEKVMQAIDRIYKWPPMHSLHIDKYKNIIEEQFILTSLGNS
jgi:CubicO group peptidase (beta-lactamase class C family)